jgi:hypothetical protein
MTNRNAEKTCWFIDQQKILIHEKDLDVFLAGREDK